MDGLAPSPAAGADRSPLLHVLGRLSRAGILHVGVHVAMIGAMAGAMIGGHSSLRALIGSAALVALAIGLAPFARHHDVVRGHVLDCFAMALGLVASVVGPVDAAVSPHAHGTAGPAAGVALLALVVGGWAAARLLLLRAARTGLRAALAGAGLTAAGLTVMLAMG